MAILPLEFPYRSETGNIYRKLMRMGSPDIFLDFHQFSLLIYFFSLGTFLINYVLRYVKLLFALRLVVCVSSGRAVACSGDLPRAGSDATRG